MTRPHFHSLMRQVTILAMLLVLGCRPMIPAAPTPAGTSPGAPVSRPISLISPIEFFPPEQKRLSQHLNWSTGCFEVKYSGPAVQIQTRAEIWTGGKPPDSNGGSNSVGAGNNEISIVVRDDASISRKGNAYKVTTAVSSATGSASGNMTVASPDLGSWSSTVAKIPNPVELVRGQEIAVWALMYFKQTSGKHRDTPDPQTPILEQAKESDWAIVLKVELDPRP